MLIAHGVSRGKRRALNLTSPVGAAYYVAPTGLKLYANFLTHDLRHELLISRPYGAENEESSILSRPFVLPPGQHAIEIIQFIKTLFSQNRHAASVLTEIPGL